MISCRDNILSKLKRACLVCLVVTSILLGLATESTNAQTTLELRSSLESPKSGLVRLVDVAIVTDQQPEIAKQLEAIVLFPAPGRTTRVSRQQVSDRLDLLGVDLFDIRWVGEQHVQIVVPSKLPRSGKVDSAVRPASHVEPIGNKNLGMTVQQRKEVEDFCKQSFAEELNKLDLRIDGLNLSAPSQSVLAGGAKIRRVGFVEELKEGLNEVSLEVEDGNQLRVIGAELLVSEAVQVVYLKQAIQRGSIIRTEDLVVSSAPQRGNTDDWIMDPASVIGKEYIGGAQPDAPLRLRSVRERLLVRVNEAVTVETIAGNLRVMTRGKAKENGALGAMITVELPGDRGKLMAEVVGEQRVEVKQHGARLLAR